MNGAEAIADVLKDEGVEHVFSHAGGTISLLLDAIHKAGIRVFVFRNEAGAGHAAQAAFRVTQHAQVVIVTSGPGATNLVTPVADAYYDSDAIVALVGQVGTDSMKGNMDVRQRGFQETPTLDIMRPVTKRVYGPLNPIVLRDSVRQALAYSASERPGPCVVDCPMDLQRGEVDDGANYLVSPAIADVAAWDAEEVAAAIMVASNPLIVAGRGALSSYKEVRTFVGKTGIPLVASLPAVGIIPTDWPHYKGMLGHTGHERANAVVRDADCIISLGARLDLRQTGTLTDEWEKGKTIIRVDIDKGEMENSRIRVDYPCQCSVFEWLREVAPLVNGDNDKRKGIYK